VECRCVSQQEDCTARFMGRTRLYVRAETLDGTVPIAIKNSARRNDDIAKDKGKQTACPNAS